MNDINQTTTNKVTSEEANQIKKKRRGRIEGFKRFIRLHFLHTPHTPHEIALGAAIGMFVAWTPAIGLHILMVLAITAVVRASRLIALILIWVSNPFTAFAIYYPSYLVGKFLLKPFTGSTTSKGLQIGSGFGMGPIEIIKGIFTTQFWHHLFDVLLKTGLELWVGTIVIGPLVAIVSYAIVYKATIWYRQKNPRRRFM